MAHLLSFIPRKSKELVAALVPQRRASLAAVPISAFESEVAAVIARTSPYSEHVILHVIIAIVALALILGSIAKVDEVVTSSGGLIATKEGPIYVEPLNQGIVHQIMVKAGDVVTQGQVLATLDPTFTTADVTQQREHLASDQALVDRLEAEQAGRPYVPKSDGKFELLQQTQWRQRQQEYAQTVAGYDAQIKSMQAQLGQAQHDVTNLTTRLKANVEIETMRKNVEAQGWGSRLLTDQATDMRAEIAGELEDAQQQVQQYTHNVENLTAQKAVYIETWKDYIANNLVTTRNDLDQTAQALTKADKLQDLVTLTSPENAVVLQIASASTGSVVASSTPNAVSGQQQPLFTLTKIDDIPEAELEIDADQVAFIRVGDPVTLEVDALQYLRFGTADAIVKTISEGSFTEEDNGTVRSPFFKVWVEVTKLNFHNVPKNVRLIPGMTVTGDIRVGKRTVISYLVEGVLRNAYEAMREP